MCLGGGPDRVELGWDTPKLEALLCRSTELSIALSQSSRNDSCTSHQSSRRCRVHTSRPAARSTSRHRQHLPNCGTPAATDRPCSSCTSHLSHTAHSSHLHLHLVRPNITMICLMTCVRCEQSRKEKMAGGLYLRGQMLDRNGTQCDVWRLHRSGGGLRQLLSIDLL